MLLRALKTAEIDKFHGSSKGKAFRLLTRCSFGNSCHFKYFYQKWHGITYWYYRVMLFHRGKPLNLLPRLWQIYWQKVDEESFIDKHLDIYSIKRSLQSSILCFFLIFSSKSAGSGFGHFSVFLIPPHWHVLVHPGYPVYADMKDALFLL